MGTDLKGTSRPDGVPLLVFALDSRRFALPAGQVREIVHAVAVAALPKAPPIVEGAINYRGIIVPILNIRRRFNLPDEPLHPTQHFIVAHAGPRLVALRVDRATDLLSVPDDAIEPATRSVPGAGYVLGIAKLADGLIVIHDLEQFLALDEAQHLDAALEGARSEARPQRGKGAR